MNHIENMKRALKLAELGKHKVSPNPAVGAVLVKNGTVIGEGFHKGSGSLHAEIEAIENATMSPRGAILYTTLEPCCSNYPGKKQSPCTDRIIKEGISHVVISMEDPNSHVCGKGITTLRSAGVTVTTGCLIEETQILNKVFIKNMLQKLPYVHLKIAQTIDGKIATESGHSKWITDEEARADVQNLRSEYDGILIGSHTAAMDDPLLTVRNCKEKSMHRIVLNRNLSLNLSLNLFKDQFKNPTTIGIDANEVRNLNKKTGFRQKGIDLMEFDCGENGKIPLVPLLKMLYQKGICSVLVEGGASLYTSLLKEKLYDEITFYIAPRICGKGLSSFGQLNTQSMDESINFIDPEIRTINGQVVLTVRRS